jgi:hypothetical protein
MKRKIFSILFALVLALSLVLVPAVVSANPGAGDVTIIVQNQAGTPIEGAQVRLFWGGPAWAWMEPKLTDSSGTATFTATEIASLPPDFGYATSGFDPTTANFQASASDSNGVYGNVYTWAVADEMPCIAYSASTEYTFTYNLIMFTKAAPDVDWGTETVTVTYTLGETLTALLTPKMGFFHGPLAEATTDIFQAYPKAGGGWDFYDMIDTDESGTITVDDYVDATVSGTSLSATVALRFLAGINDNIIAVPFLVKTPVTHEGLTEGEKTAAEDMYGVGSSLTVGLMTLTSESVKMTADVPAPIISISVSPLSIDFGRVYAGSSSAPQSITVTNTSHIVSEDITASVTSESRAGFYETNLKLDTVSVASWAITSLTAGNSQPVEAVLNVSPGTGVGTLTATLVFWAEEAAP